MNGKRMVYIDQYGNVFYADSVKKLRSSIGMGGSRVSKMYHDATDGSVKHIGYVIAGHWLTAYAPVEFPYKKMR